MLYSKINDIDSTTNVIDSTTNDGDNEKIKNIKSNKRYLGVNQPSSTTRNIDISVSKDKSKDLLENNQSKSILVPAPTSGNKNSMGDNESDDPHGTSQRTVRFSSATTGKTVKGERDPRYGQSHTTTTKSQTHRF